MKISTDELKEAYYRTGSIEGVARKLGVSKRFVAPLLKEAGIVMTKRQLQNIEYRPEAGNDYIKNMLNLKIGQKIKVVCETEGTTKVVRRIGTRTVAGVYPNFVLTVDKRGVKSCYTYGELYSLYMRGENENE